MVQCPSSVGGRSEVYNLFPLRLGSACAKSEASAYSGNVVPHDSKTFSFILMGGRSEKTLDVSRIRVIDGETFSYGGESIRVHGVTAPLALEQGGKEARQQLEDLLQQGRVTMIPKGSDR